MSLRTLFAVGLVVLPLAPAYGQPRGRVAQAPMAQAGEMQGTITGVANSMIQMKTATNETMVVGLTPMTAVRLTATAKPEALRSGMSVEFVAEVQKGGVVKDKVDHLTIFTPSQTRQPGLHPPEAAVKKGEGEGGLDLGLGGPIGGDPGIGMEPEQGPGGRRTRGKRPPAGGAAVKPTAPQLPGSFCVRGIVRGFRDGSLTVQAGKQSLKLDLAENATIDVETSDYSLAGPGDTIHVKGQPAGRPGLIRAEKVSIEVAEPLTGKKRSRTGKPAGKVEGKAPAAAEDDPLGLNPKAKPKAKAKAKAEEANF